MVDIEIPVRDIVWLGDLNSQDVSRVGAKAAHLSRLAANHLVPDGFVLTADASLRAGANGRLSPELRIALQNAYVELAQRTGEPAPSVAVRSSAVDEDGPTASFAGQHETLLNIRGAERLIEAVERCWDSARSPQALAYRQQHGLSTDRIGLAVLVQLMVQADTSGVVFSANPVSGNRGEVVVTASWGLGESIVGGSVTPDTWIVQRDSLDLIESRLGDKRRMTVPTPNGTLEVDVPRILREQPSLSPQQARNVASLALSLESSMDWPVDIEFAWKGGELYLLQCRPITTLATIQAVVDHLNVDDLASVA